MGSAQSESLLLLLEYCGGREKNFKVCGHNNILGMLFCHTIKKTTATVA